MSGNFFSLPYFIAKKFVGTGGSTAIPSVRNYSAIPYNVTNFHPPCVINNYNDAYNVRNCELVGLHDLNQTEEDTRAKITDYFNDLIDLGVAGTYIQTNLRFIKIKKINSI